MATGGRVMAGKGGTAHGWLHRFWLARLSRPAGERIIHRHVLRHGPARILELGLGRLVRTERMLRATAGRGAGPGQPVHYVGLDRFEGRLASDPPGVSLKEAHRRLHGLARVQLVPGNADSALARTCNHLGTFDLVLVSADNDQRHLERCWGFLVRLARADTTVFVESSGGSWTVLERQRLEALAGRVPMRRAG